MKRAVEAILAEYETKTLKAKLLEFPALIKQQKQKVRAASQALKDAEQAKAEAEANLVVAISSEVNPNTGKPMYSNAEARNAELTNRRKTDPAYQASLRAAREAEWAANEAQSELEQLLDQFKAYRYVADLAARELALLAAGIAEDQQQATKEPF